MTDCEVTCNSKWSISKVLIFQSEPFFQIIYFQVTYFEMINFEVTYFPSGSFSKWPIFESVNLEVTHFPKWTIFEVINFFLFVNFN